MKYEIKKQVDSYEGEVGILETALNKLRSHKWGDTSTTPDNNNHEALIEALSMERGQQPLSPEKRREMIQSIVAQQREQVANLMECQLENWILGYLASSMLRTGGESGIAPGSNPISDNGNGGCSNNDNSGGSVVEAKNTTDFQKDEDLAQLTSELQSILQLTPTQLSRIHQSSHGCAREIHDLHTIDNCLQSILANEWLLDEGVDEVAGQFTSILNPTQLSKFLLWSDHNADAIEKLDYVNVGVGIESGPVFEFGIDEGMEGGD